MTKLSKSTVILIILAVTAIILGVVLFLSMPETMAENFNIGQRLENRMESRMMFDGAAGKQSFSREGISGKPGGRLFGRFPVGILFLIGLGVFLLRRSRGFRGMRNHSKAILDEQFAEEKISEEEYKRKRMILEEE